MQMIDSARVRTNSRAPLGPALVLVGGSLAVGPLRRAADEAGLGFVHRPTSESAADWLKTQSPGAVLIDLQQGSDRELFSELRSSPRWAHVPLIALTQEPTELAFAETFWAGGDDVVHSGDMEQLIPRLRATRYARPQPPVPSRRVVVGGADAPFRLAATRVLEGAGYCVEIALTADAVVSAALERRAELIVASIDLPPSTALQALESVRDAGCEVPFVLSVTPRFLARTRLLARKVKNVTVCNTFAPPDDILFSANELLMTPSLHRRATRRLPYGTRVWVRRAGGSEDVLAYTYNLSERGLFARTLFPFAPGEDAWIELAPPRHDRRVRLMGKAVWHRPFGPLGPALSPPGTGFQILGGLADDLRTYEECCRSLAGSYLI